MAEDLIRYDILAQDALRGVVRKVLSEVARTGLPGEHHFFISFATHAPGVRVSSRLLAQYPEDMTIVVQHQYWDLAVTEHAFDIGLSFDGVPERLHVPFTAVKGFLDPSVQFGLQFEIATKPGELPGESPRVLEDNDEEQPAYTNTDVAPTPLPLPVAETAAEAAPDSDDETADDGPPANDAQVVSLDAFRKKN
ncbi:MAG: ClpXP protease specificity-enhancing factor SspB [Bauldia litoralis]